MEGAARKENIATLLLLFLLAATLAQNRWEDRAIRVAGSPRPIARSGGGEGVVSRFIAGRLVNKSGRSFSPAARERTGSPNPSSENRAEISIVLRIINLRGTTIPGIAASIITLLCRSFLLSLSLSFSLRFLPISLNVERIDRKEKKKKRISLITGSPRRISSPSFIRRDNIFPSFPERSRENGFYRG